MLYVVKQDETVYDLAILLYGDATYAVKLVSDNSLLDDLDNLNIVGLSIYYDETIKASIKPSYIRNTDIIPKPNNNYFIVERQSIWDLSIMYGFGIESAISFIKQASIENINEINIAGRILDVTKTNTKLSKYLDLQKIVLATNYELYSSIGEHKQFQDGSLFEFQFGETYYFNN